MSYLFYYFILFLIIVSVKLPNASVTLSSTLPESHYYGSTGEDSISLYGSSIATSSNFTVIGSNGYSTYNGMVRIYRSFSNGTWNLQSTLYSPVGQNSNFGLSVDQDGDYLVVSANAYGNLFK